MVWLLTVRTICLSRMGSAAVFLKFTPSGVRSTFAARRVAAMAFQPNAAPTDFNNDGKPDYVLYNPTTRRTWIWYLNNEILIGNAYGPAVWSGWSVVAP
jgi:hypothetical protein